MSVDPKTVTTCNGETVIVDDLIGPVVSDNGCQWWLVRMIYNNKLIDLGHDNGCEFFICREPVNDAWGWDVDKRTPMVTYAFANAIKRLLEAK